MLWWYYYGLEFFDLSSLLLVWDCSIALIYMHHDETCDGYWCRDHFPQKLLMPRSFVNSVIDVKVLFEKHYRYRGYFQWRILMSRSWQVCSWIMVGVHEFQLTLCLINREIWYYLYLINMLLWTPYLWLIYFNTCDCHIWYLIWLDCDYENLWVVYWRLLGLAYFYAIVIWEG